MTRWFVDTSAAVKLLVEEPESVALARAVDDPSVQLCGCWLLETELRRAANRIDSLTQEAVTELLADLDVFSLPASAFREAGLLPGPDLRSLDALHLVAALRTRADALVTYDVRMASSARQLGLTVVAPR